MHAEITTNRIAKVFRNEDSPALAADLFGEGAKPASEDERREKAKRRRGNIYDAVKLLAFVTMVIDHIALYYIIPLPWLRAVGRISAPIYLFMAGWHLSTDISSRLVMSFAMVTWMYQYIIGRSLPLDILFTVVIARVLLRFVLPKVDWPKNRSKNKTRVKANGGQSENQSLRAREKLGVSPDPDSALSPLERTLLPSGPYAVYRFKYLVPTLAIALVLTAVFSYMNWVLLDYDWTGVMYIIVGAHARIAIRLYNEAVQSNEQELEDHVSAVDYVKAILIDVERARPEHSKSADPPAQDVSATLTKPLSKEPNSKDGAKKRVISSFRPLSATQARINLATVLATIVVLSVVHYAVYQRAFDFQGVAHVTHAIVMFLSAVLFAALILAGIPTVVARVSLLSHFTVTSSASGPEVSDTTANPEQSQSPTTHKSGLGSWTLEIAKYCSVYSLELYVLHLFFILITMPSLAETDKTHVATA